MGNLTKAVEIGIAAGGLYLGYLIVQRAGVIIPPSQPKLGDIIVVDPDVIVSPPNAGYSVFYLNSRLDIRVAFIPTISLVENSNIVSDHPLITLESGSAIEVIGALIPPAQGSWTVKFQAIDANGMDLANPKTIPIVI